MKFLKADKPITTTHKTLRDDQNVDGEGDLTVDVEVPQFDSIDEFVKAVGGDTSALESVNSWTDRDAKAAGRTALRTAKDGTDLETLYKNVRDIVKSFVPKSSDRGPSKAVQARQNDAIRAKLEAGETLTREQLMEMLGIAI